jgi:hypothetical protein
MKSIKKDLLLLSIFWASIICMGAVSYDTNNPNAAIEEELIKLNSNMERLIAVTEMRLSYINEVEDNQAKILYKIYLSLQPNAYDINGELIKDED